ncbi:MAG: hypothetical protein LH624_18570 [Cryobacterium sp.]|nr:hypothetical protein [Cryobacterium sp.]
MRRRSENWRRSPPRPPGTRGSAGCSTPAPLLAPEQAALYTVDAVE